MSTTERILTNADGTPIQKEITTAPQDSLELSVNAKGEPTWCLKVYGADAEEIAARVEKLRALAERHASEIRAGKGA